MKRIVFLFLFSFGLQAQVVVTPLFGGDKNLKLAEATLKNKVLFFFKGDCSSCRQQARDLTCVKDKVISLGFLSDLKTLQKEARLMGLKDNVYFAPEKVTKAFAMTKGYSPVIFAFNSKGKSKSWLGLHNCQIFAKWLADNP